MKVRKFKLLVIFMHHETSLNGSGFSEMLNTHPLIGANLGRQKPLFVPANIGQNTGDLLTEFPGL